MEQGHPYNRAGILLTGLIPAGSQPLLWGDADPGRARLAAAVDEVAARFGKAAIGYGPTGLRTAPRWQMRREKLSPAATTDWKQLLTVR
jgi:DNA polymerase V